MANVQVINRDDRQLHQGDIYRDIEPGKKSMAYNLTFKDDTRTLSDEEVMQVFNNVIKEVEAKLDAKLRG